MSSYLKLKAELATLDLKIDVALATEKAKAISEIQAKMQEWQIPLRDLAEARAAHGGPTGKKRQSSVKYIDPESGATWSGMGRAPVWIAGKDRKKFEIR
jgi:DNA-binding protein H-NS